MAESVLSGKKLEYLNSLEENLAKTRDNTISAIETVKAVADKAKIACAYRAANVLVKIANAQLEVVASGGKGGAELAETLKKEGKPIGEALVNGAAKVLGDLEPLAVKADDIPLYSDATIAGAGLEDNWTTAVQGEFNDACMAFVQVRANSIRDLSDTTRKVVTGDFDEIYMAFGKKLEADYNEITRIFNSSMTVFEAAGVNIAKMQADAKAAANVVGNTDIQGTVGAIDEV
jgi:hypothetical protein